LPAGRRLPRSELGLGQALCDILRNRGQLCVSVHQQSLATFDRTGGDVFVIDPANGEHYRLLMGELAGQAPAHIVHLTDYAEHIQFSNAQTIRSASGGRGGQLIS
jgi:hypothetical protein